MVIAALDVPHDRARRKIRAGNLLLFGRQRFGLGGKLIATAGRSECDHAVVGRGSLLLAENTQSLDSGVRRALLASTDQPTLNSGSRR
jgi:hypothetical protein